MRYFKQPWDDQDQWLPPIEDPDDPALVASAAPPRFATPPFVPAAAAPIGPLPPPRPITAMDQLQDLSANAPLRSDPNLQPSKTRKVLGGLAGAALGFGEGWVNASGRARVAPGGGAALADSIVNSKYNKAKRDYDEKSGALKSRAQIEQAKADAARKQAESDARIKSETAQEAAARAREAQAGRIPAPKPIERDPSKDLYDPATGKVILKGTPKADAPVQTPFQAKERIRNNPNLTPEEKKTAIAEIEANSGVKEKSITRIVQDEHGNLTAVTVNPSDVVAAGGRKVLGPGGKAMKPKAQLARAAPPASTSGPLSPDAQAVYDGRIIFDKLPQKERSAIRQELLAKTDWQQPNQSTVGERNKEAEGKAALEGVQELRTVLEKNKDSLGPVAGIAGMIPYTDARKLKAKIDLVRQRVGKSLEGGVLRKEDEKKYKEILAGLMDNPDLAISKVDNIIETLERDIRIAAEVRNNAGRSPRNPNPGQGGKPKVGDIRTGPDGKKYRITAIRGDEVDAEPVN